MSENKKSALPYIIALIAVIIVAATAIVIVLMLKDKPDNETKDKQAENTVSEEGGTKKNDEVNKESSETDKQTGKESENVETQEQEKESEKTPEKEKGSTDSEKTAEPDREEEKSDPETEYQKLIKEAEKYSKKGNRSKAIAAYNEAVDLDPTAAAAYLGLYEIYIEGQEYTEAGIVIESGLESVKGKSGQMNLKMKEEELDKFINPAPTKEAENKPTPTNPPAVTDEPEEGQSYKADDYFEYSWDYTLEDSDTRKYEEYDFNNWTLAHIRMAKNEIYARKGLQFNDPQVQHWFSGKNWYTPKYPAGTEEKLLNLSSIESHNKEVLRKLEEKITNSGDIYSWAQYEELYDYDLILSKDQLALLEAQLKKMPQTDMVKYNLKKVQETLAYVNKYWGK